MKRWLFLAIALGACVPASEAAPPAGAAGFDTKPSAASRGEPFTTPDGWTLRFERFALEVMVVGSNVESGGGDSVAYRFDARDRVQLWVSGIPAGGSTVRIYPGRFDNPAPAVVDLVRDRETAARFDRPADGVLEVPYVPVVVFSVVATNGERRVRLELAIGAEATAHGPAVSLDVKADALALVPLPIAGEQLFISGFESFATADQDGDGILSIDELRDGKLYCSVSSVPCYDVPNQPLLSVLLDRAGYLFTEQ